MKIRSEKLRRTAALASIASTAMIGACGGGGGGSDFAVGSAADPDSALAFKATGGTSATVNVYGTPISYTAYTVTYVAKPNDPEKQVMAIYVPSTATQSSPIFMPLKTGAYREVNVLKPLDVIADDVNTPSTGTDGSGAARAAARAPRYGSPPGGGPEHRLARLERRHWQRAQWPR
jgi:hypothetical protein